MKSLELDTERIKLGELKYFDEEHNGAAVLPINAYVFLLETDSGSYYNLLNPYAIYPIYKKVPYSNTTSDGEDYGSKIIHVNGEEKTGLCYILENKTLKDLSGKETITINELENYVIKSDLFFIDRLDIAEDLFTKIKYRKKLEDDAYKLDTLNSYYRGFEKNTEYRKVMR